MKTDSFKIVLDGAPEPLIKKRKLAYKGFNSALQGYGGFQFEIGQTYTKEKVVEKPKTCSLDGYHYANTLKQVFTHYPTGGENRYCVIEVLGNFTDETDKSTTTSIAILEEISKDAIERYAYEENINLPTLRKIQQFNPFLHVGGSAALFLHGIELDRIRNNSGQPCDIDVVSPFYHFLQGDKDDKIEASKTKNSGNDFHEGFYFNKIGVDMRIDNEQKYDIITYNGFPYKVSKLEVVMTAKLRYSLNGQDKHQKDCAEIMGVKPIKDKATSTVASSADVDDIDILF